MSYSRLFCLGQRKRKGEVDAPVMGCVCEGWVWRKGLVGKAKRKRVERSVSRYASQVINRWK